MKLRIASVQLNPIMGKFEQNCRRALGLLDRTFGAGAGTPIRKPDLIIFPELSLTGYDFKDKAAITPYLELQGKGKTFELGKQVSEKYRCHTLIGYPEKYPEAAGGFKIYNSAALISPSGDMAFHYRKSFMYSTDERWGCEESPEGFQAFNLTINGETVKSAIGICMDLSPYKFEAPFTKFEFSTFCNDNDVQLVLVPTAWMNSKWKEKFSAAESAKYNEAFAKGAEDQINVTPGPADSCILNAEDDDDDEGDAPFDLSKPDSATARYWIMRFNPMYTKPKSPKRKLIVICNRSGIENGVTMYAGSSTILRLNGQRAMVDPVTNAMYIDFDLYGTLGQGIEGVLVRDVEL